MTFERRYVTTDMRSLSKKTKQLYIKKKIFDELSPGWGLDEWNYSVIPILQTHYIDVFISSTSGGGEGGYLRGRLT